MKATRTNRLLLILISIAVYQTAHAQSLRSDISLSDPFVMADEATHKYYMTGTGGKLWVSDDLEVWTNPTTMVSTPSTSWMGASPEIWASELHCVDGKYYNISTFTNKSITIDAAGHSRRAVHILRSDLPSGTYSLTIDGATLTGQSYAASPSYTLSSSPIAANNGKLVAYVPNGTTNVASAVTVKLTSVP